MGSLGYVRVTCFALGHLLSSLLLGTLGIQPEGPHEAQTVPRKSTHGTPMSAEQWYAGGAGGSSTVDSCSGNGLPNIFSPTYKAIDEPTTFPSTIHSKTTKRFLLSDQPAGGPWPWDAPACGRDVVGCAGQSGSLAGLLTWSAGAHRTPLFRSRDPI